MVDNWLYINAYTEKRKYCETTVDSYKFKNDEILKSISFVNDKVLKISSGAFMGCSNLVNVDLPKKLIFICKRAFMNCTSIEQITIPATVKLIDRNAFTNCTRLSNVSLHEGILEIKGEAFSFCPNLAELNIPDSVKVLGLTAFKHSHIQTLYLPQHLSYMAEHFSKQADKIIIRD